MPLFLFHFQPIFLLDMVIAEEVQHPVHREKGQLPQKAVPILLRLCRRTLKRDHEIAEHHAARRVDDRGFLALREGKGEDIRRTIHAAIVAVEHVDVRIIRQRHTDLRVHYAV